MATPPPQAFLLVDGYNIIGHWPCLKQTRDRHGLEPARRELVETLINYTAHNGYKAEVVFDAQYRKTPSIKEQFTPTLAVCYTAFAETADTYIEKICAGFSRKTNPTPSRIIVATSDRAQQLTVVGYGAEWFSAQHFSSEVDTTIRHISKRKRPQQPTQGRFLANSLDAQVRQRLAELRLGIVTPEA
jgi:predicted RNA-binding protein with PIN domain